MRYYIKFSKFILGIKLTVLCLEVDILLYYYLSRTSLRNMSHS